jgi:hypothetical protein
VKRQFSQEICTLICTRVCSHPQLHACVHTRTTTCRLRGKLGIGVGRGWNICMRHSNPRRHVDLCKLCEASPMKAVYLVLSKSCMKVVYLVLSKSWVDLARVTDGANASCVLPHARREQGLAGLSLRFGGNNRACYASDVSRRCEPCVYPCACSRVPAGCGCGHVQRRGRARFKQNKRCSSLSRPSMSACLTCRALCKVSRNPTT